MSLSHEHVGPKILGKIKVSVLSRAELLFPLCYEIPCSKVEFFRSFFWENWRYQKEISKLINLCMPCIEFNVFMDSFDLFFFVYFNISNIAGKVIHVKFNLEVLLTN